MIFDTTKDSRQEDATIKWRNNHGIGCINACPRFGKTRIGLKIIDKIYYKLPKEPNILILVPSEIVEKTWNSQLTKKAVVLTSNKAKNLLAGLLTHNYDLLIVDEVHKFTSEENLKLLSKLAEVSKFRLALTATYPKDNNVIERLFPVIDVITEEEALERGWISDFVEYNIPTELNKEEKHKYIKFSQLISETLALFKGKLDLVNKGSSFLRDDLELIYACHSGKKFKKKYVPGHVFRDILAAGMGWTKDLDLSNPHNKERDVYWNPNNIYERCKTFKTFVAKRNELLINNENKLKLILQICDTNRVPTIIFNENIEFVNTIADALGHKAIAYHSKIKSRPVFDEEVGDYIRFSTGRIKMFGAATLKNEALEGIRTGRYLYLVTAKALDEGLDLPELEQVIITAGSHNPLQQIQRSSRGKTIDGENVNKFTRIFNLYIDDFRDDFGELIRSRDKSKLYERQKNYEHSVKWVNDLSEITL